MADIADAFHRTPFSVPGVNIQPEGDVTLVTLPTYVELKFPEKGFEPEEIDPINLMGFDVKIKPILRDVTYYFGDGTSMGPTKSPGGPYPSGDIIKTYANSGVFDVRADVVYLGQFSINGSEWIDIPGSAPIAGTPVPLTVKTANNHLYLNAGDHQ